MVFEQRAQISNGVIRMTISGHHVCLLSQREMRDAQTGVIVELRIQEVNLGRIRGAVGRH